MIRQYRKHVNELKAQYDLIERRLAEERREEAKMEAEIGSVTEAQQIAQQIAQHLQHQAQTQISRVVSRCLNAVFDEPYEFVIRFDQKRGKTEARLVFRRDGVEFDDPMNSIGGGVIDVASLALRLACILLARPARRRLVVLDEPFKNIRGDKNKARTQAMLIRLAEEMGIQWIINTEIPAYQLGKVVEL